MFNLRGAIKQILDAEGKSTTFGTNAFGERRSINQSIDATTTLATSYGFDRRGLALNEFQIGGGSFRVGFFNTYDAFGRLTSSMNSNGNTTTYDYDRLGRTVTVTDATEPAPAPADASSGGCTLALVGRDDSTTWFGIALAMTALGLVALRRRR